jgi:uncharacterized protein (DUF169 family)
MLTPLTTDLSIFKKFNYKRQPVGVKFLFGRPKDIKELEVKAPMCEMFKLAQDKDYPFYMSKENENCVGRLVMGMEKFPAYTDAGELGPLYGIFKNDAPNKKMYDFVPMFQKGTVNYVAFARLDKLTFEPDLLITIGAADQGEKILRAMSWSTGVPWEAKASSALGCAWLFVHPIKELKVNYIFTGMQFGMKAKHFFEEGQIIISIPFNWIPTIAKNLSDMEWDLPAYTMGREAFEKVELESMVKLAELYKDEESSAGVDLYKKRD